MESTSQAVNKVEELEKRIEELETREKELLKRLRTDSSFHSMVLDALPINVFLEDPMGRTIFANKQACQVNGMELSELIGKTVFDFFPIHIAQKQREIDLEVWKERKLMTKEVKVGFQGKESYMFTGKTIIELPESNEEFLLGFGLDITELKKAEEKIAHMAYHDALTGLPNRRYINSYLEDYRADNKNTRDLLAVLLIDLDHFKVINDSLGHQAGDVLLKSVANRLKKTIGKGKVVARFGGDEFVILLPNLASIEESLIMSNQILEVMEQPFIIFGQRFNISPSIGVSIYPDHGKDINTLIKNADLAMYHSKEKGRNCFSLFVSKMKYYAMVRMDTEIQIRQALENQEFTLHYQPKLNLETGKIAGVEALIRWENKDGKLSYPDSFIPIAEDSGLIVPLGEWVLYEACSQCKQWHDEGYPDLSVSVNLSPKQFLKQNLPDLITSVLEKTGLPATYLELELTESTVMKEPETAVQILWKLKQIGVSVSIDDFGTGFSSLNYLKQFPIDTLKIDKSFIKNLEWDETNSTISLAVISLAHNLGLKVVAEGVETAEQLKFLQTGDCEYVQGYFISKPIEKNKITEFVSSIYV